MTAAADTDMMLTPADSGLLCGALIGLATEPAQLDRQTDTNEEKSPV